MKNPHACLQCNRYLHERDAIAAELAALKIEQKEFLAEHARRGLRHEARVKALEAALKARGHSDVCITRVRGNFPCDCGLDDMLAAPASKGTSALNRGAEQ